jgi:hypothetical protein
MPPAHPRSVANCTQGWCLRGAQRDSLTRRRATLPFAQSRPSVRCFAQEGAQRAGEAVSNGESDQELAMSPLPEITSSTRVPRRLDRRVVERARDLDPDRAVFRAKIVGQIRPGHQMHPKEPHASRR